MYECMTQSHSPIDKLSNDKQFSKEELWTFNNHMKEFFKPPMIIREIQIKTALGFTALIANWQRQWKRRITHGWGVVGRQAHWCIVGGAVNKYDHFGKELGSMQRKCLTCSYWRRDSITRIIYQGRKQALIQYLLRAKHYTKYFTRRPFIRRKSSNI